MGKGGFRVQGLGFIGAVVSYVVVPFERDCP